MPFTTSPVNGCAKQVEERQDAPEMSPVRPTGDFAGHRVDFYLIHLTVGVPGFTMRWTAPPLGPASGERFRGSDLRVVQEFSTVFTYGAATDTVRWRRT